MVFPPFLLSIRLSLQCSGLRPWGICGTEPHADDLVRAERALYHFDNHPVKWVRITGVVVAVDEFKGKRVFTVDDSSGMCIECTAVAPPPPPQTENDKPSMPSHLNQIASLMTGRNTGVLNAAGDKKMREGKDKEMKAGAKGKEGRKIAPSVQSPAVPWDEVDVGTVVKVKGRVTNWWDTIQIEVIKIEVLGCTDQEVRCWNEVSAFKKDVLSKPWVVSQEEEEKCRREREKELRRARNGAGGKRTGAGNGGGNVDEDKEKGDRERRKKKKAEMERREEDAKRRKAKEEERLKARTYPSMAVLKAAKGKYDALGI